MNVAATSTQTTGEKVSLPSMTMTRADQVGRTKRALVDGCSMDDDEWQYELPDKESAGVSFLTHVHPGERSDEAGHLMYRIALEEVHVSDLHAADEF